MSFEVCAVNIKVMFYPPNPLNADKISKNSWVLLQICYISILKTIETKFVLINPFILKTTKIPLEIPFFETKINASK
jgi:hypothetical protein